MPSIATTTNAAPIQYPANTLIDRDKNTGYLYCLLRGTAANTQDLYRSTNGGTTWSLLTSRTRANLVELGSIFVGSDSWLRWIYRTNESSQDRIYITGMNLNTGVWESELLLANPSNGGVAGAYHQGLDLWVTITGSSEYYVIAAGTTVGANSGVTLYGAYTATIPGTTISKNSIIRGTRQWLFAGTGRQGPSLDAQHNADGKTASTPSLWVAFGRVGAYVAKLSWQGDGWQGPTTPVTLATGITARDYIPGRWDGSRFCVALANGTLVDLYERNIANTETTQRTSAAHPQGVIRAITLSWNKVNGDVRVFAVGTTINDLYYTDFVRSTGLWSGWAAVTTDDIIGANVDNFGVRRSTHGNSKYDVITARTTAPQIQLTQLGLNYTPGAPVWNFTGLSYVNGGARDVTGGVPLNWDFVDPDLADVQSAYALSRQINAGTLNYWRASDSTWQVAEVKNVTGTSSVTIPTVWAVDGDIVTWKVKTWDVTDVASVYSEALVLVASTPVNPTITSPGATVTSDAVTVTWTVAEQTAYRVTTEIFGFELQDSGWVESTDLTYTSPERLENGFNYTVKLTTKNNEGLASVQQSATFLVAFTVPQIPTLVATPSTALGHIAVAVTNPAGAFINAGAAAHGNNASVVPALPSGITPDQLQLLLVLAAIRNSGTGTVNLPAGWTDLVNFGNVRLFGKLYVTGDTAPTVTFTGGVANADTSAQMAAFRGYVPTVAGTAATQLNGSAQDIATPALTITMDSCLALRIGWKQDDTTGATPAGGMTEIGDLSTTTGDDQSLTWAYTLQTTAANLAASSFVMAGGAAAISRGIAVALVGAPAIAYNEIFRIETGDVGNGIRIANNLGSGGTALDFRARSGVDYSYRVLARGTTGASVYGVWTP